MNATMLRTLADRHWALSSAAQRMSDSETAAYHSAEARRLEREAIRAAIEGRRERRA